MSVFLAEDMRSAPAYTPGEQPRGREYVKLNTNENPYFPSKYALAAAGEEELRDLRLYSDPECAELRDAIADFYSLKRENVIPANGSDEILAFCFRAYGHKGAVFPDVTYGFYPVFARLFGVPFAEIPLKEDFSVDVADYFGAGRMVVLANPNAQTGRYLPLSEIARVAAANARNAVIVDEAYIDFGGESAAKLIGEYDNLIVVQTFSKSRSLAGARVGFALASAALVADLEKIKFSFNPYNVNRLSGRLAARAIADRSYFEDCRTRIIATRERFSARLEAAGFEVIPSLANFVMARKRGVPGRKLYEDLKSAGFLVRHFGQERIADFVRITIGGEEDMSALASAMEEVTK